MAVSEAHIRASIKWNRKHDSITIRPEKERGEEIRAAAQKAGRGLQEFILEAIEEKMAREGGPA